MSNTREIKRRIKGVQSMEQITKAMKLVATSKVQKAKQRVETNRFYFSAMQDVVKNAMNSNEKIDSPFLKKTKVNNEKRNVLYILLASDRGLCGGYNINLFKEMYANLDKDANNMFITFGRKAKEYCKRKGLNIVKDVVGLSESPSYTIAREFGDLATKMFLNDEVDEVYIVYTHFISIITQEQKIYKLLPVVNAQGESEEDKDSNVSNESKERNVAPLLIYEPDPETVLSYVIPKYINSIIYGGMLEANASEEGSRMTAMDNATTNAIEISNNLTLTYNRIRQSSITTEISEIVGGANALNA